MATKELKAKIILNNKTAVEFSTTNPVLLKGELGIEIDTGLMKVGDGVKAWNELDYTNDVNVSDLPLGQEFKFTRAFGKYSPDASGSYTIDATEMSINDLLESAFADELQPAVTQPSVSITMSQAKAYEVGTKVTPSYTTSFNKGKYTYGPDTGVTVSNYSVSDGTNTVEGATGSFPELTVSDGANYKLTVTATHGAGATPLTNLGNTATVAGISAGTKTATSGTITGYRAMFAGSKTAPIELNSANIRGLTNVGAAKNYNLSVVEGAKQVIIALPAGKTLKNVKDVNAFGTDIVASFVMSNVDVEGVGSYTAQSYNVYVYTPEAALGANTYEIVIA